MKSYVEVPARLEVKASGFSPTVTSEEAYPPGSNAKENPASNQLKKDVFFID